MHAQAPRSAREPVRPRAHGATSSVARLDQARILALQRKVGNRAVTRLMARRDRVQRQLLITDQGKLFSEARQAEAYLRAEHAKEYGTPLDTPMTARLAQLAGAATDRNLVIPTPLKPALAFIQSGTALHVQPHYVDPSRSPARDDAGQWEYQMGGRAPTALEAPQSPQHLFPESPFPALNVDIPSHLDDARQWVQDEHGSFLKSTLGKNDFLYRITAELRLTQFEKKESAGTRYFGPKAAPTFGSPYARSGLYTSALNRPRKRGQADVDYTDEMREELDHIANDVGPKRPYFKAGSSLYAHERNRTAKDRGGNYFLDEARSSKTDLGQLFAHSEVQAAAHAHKEAGQALAQNLMADIICQARTEQDAGNPLQVVVVAVTWSGASSPNSVCGGACKGALIHIGEILEQQFNAQRQTAKAALSRENIFLRGSAKLNYSGHVRSDSRYSSGYGVGAMPAPNARPTRTRHRYVTEYNPLNTS